MRIPAALAALTLAAATARTEEPRRMEDVVVVATGHDTLRLDAPYAVQQVELESLRLQLPRTATEALDRVPGVMLQKTGHGMTSPFLRGFTSQRTVLMADGVRVNNAFLREGPNQYWNLIDGFFYRDLEVMMGPASVLYGSDAIGGVIYARSIPLTRGIADGGAQWIGGDATFRYASAEDSFSEHLQGEMAFDDRWSLRIGGTRQDFGELRSGNDIDNPNTDYQQWAANARLQVWLDDDHALVFGYDHFDQDDVHRVHRTIHHQDFEGTLSKGKAGDLDRIYDHDRRTAFARYEMRNGDGAVEGADLTLSYTYFAEDYNRIRSATRDDNRLTDIDTLGIALRLQTTSAWGIWNYGASVYQDTVDTAGWNVNNGVVTELDQGLVADDASYLTINAFLQNEAELHDRVVMTTGVNYAHIRLDADTVAFSNPDRIDSLEGEWDAVTGSIRFLYRALPDQRLNLFAGVSQGFRAPNLSDATREDDFGGGEESPTTDLDPEHFTTFEAGLKHRGDRTRVELTAYHTEMRDRIGRLKENGNDTKKNLDHGHIDGIEAYAAISVTPALTLFGDIAWQEGTEETYADREITNGTADRPVSRMLPFSGSVGVRWEPPQTRYWLQCTVDMAAEQDRLTDAEKGDNRFPPDGTPGYAVLHLDGGLRLGDRTQLAVSFQNLTDAEYRIHGSGVNEPGRNLVVALRHTF